MTETSLRRRGRALNLAGLLSAKQGRTRTTGRYPNLAIPGEEEDDGDVVDVVEEDGRAWRGGGGRSARRLRLS